MAARKTMMVRPATPGAVVRHPHTKRRIADTGEKVPCNNYWMRRVAQGDVIDMEAEAEAKAAEVDAPAAKPITSKSSRKPAKE